jgi:hypothetical protein
MSMARVLIAAFGLSLAFAMPAVAQRDARHSRQLTRYGLSIVLPAGWDGVAFRRVGGLPILHAANFRLPRADDDAATAAIKKMRKASVLIVLLESRKAPDHWQPLAGPPQVTRRDFLSLSKGVPPTHAFARMLFMTRQRYFQLWVQFGTRPAPTSVLKQANRVLRSLTISS